MHQYGLKARTNFPKFYCFNALEFKGEWEETMHQRTATLQVQCFQYIMSKTMCLVSRLLKTLRAQKGFNFFTETGTEP